MENPEVKASVFSQLDEIVESDDAILASNTSSLPIQSIAAATKRPERVMGLHFFNPVPVLPLVEHVVTLTTGDVQSERAYEYASEALGKTVIALRTARASLLTLCWFRTSSALSACCRTASLPQRTSMPAWSMAVRTRWVR